MELIAHRAGNDPTSMHAGLELADAIELDVHLFRGRLEVRHAKVIWPFAIRWERWAFVPRDAPRPTIDDVVRSLPPQAHLWLDLKGFHRGLTRRALEATSDVRHITVSSRSWWILAPATGRDRVRCLRSVGNRIQRWLALRTALADGWRADRGVAIHERLADPWTIERLSGSGPVVVWGVDTLDRLGELDQLGVAGAIIDDLELIRRARSSC